MKATTELMLLLSFSTIMVMIFISSVIYWAERDKRQWEGCEYWLSTGAYMLLAMFSNKHSPLIVALPTILWIWRIRTMRRILESVCKVALLKNWHYWLLLIAYLLFLYLAYLGFSFTLFTLPQSIAFFIVMMDVLIRGIRNLDKKIISVNHYLLFFTIFIISIHNLDYPFLRYNTEFTYLGFGLLLLTNILMAIILPSVTIFELKQEQQFKLEKLVEERGELLKNQSKLSALGVMTAGIAHEINNPLGVIGHRSQILRRQVLADQADKELILRGLDQIDATVKRINDIIQSLKNFSREGKRESFTECHIKNLLEETLSYCRDRFRLESIDLRIEPFHDEIIKCRSVQISQVLLNLLNNSFDAVKGTPDPWVVLSVKKMSDCLQIIVKDSGHGIPENIRLKMMEPFYTTKKFGGTGLGLSLSRKMMEEHSGKLYLDESAKNTTFIIELPYI